MIEASQKEELKPVQWLDFEYDGNKYDLCPICTPAPSNSYVPRRGKNQPSNIRWT